MRRFFCGVLSGVRDANSAVQCEAAATDTEACDVRAEPALEQGKIVGDRPLTGGESGVLTLFNHRGFSSGASWIQIPFEIALDGGAKTGSGVLRFFADTRQKKAEKCTVTLDFGGQFYCFVIYLHNGRVLYAVSGAKLADESAILEKAFEAAFGGKAFIVERAESGALSGFYEEGGIAAVRGSV